MVGPRLPSVLVKSDANDSSSRMQIGGQVHAITFYRQYDVEERDGSVEQALPDKACRPARSPWQYSADAPFRLFRLR